MTEKFIEKISRYNFFNYLFPGVLFVILAPNFFGISLMLFFHENLIASLFLAYLLGMIISRVGSMVIETFLRWVKFIEFVKHEDYLDALKKDEKIDTLSEENNIYRTLISLFSLLLLIRWLVPLLGHYVSVSGIYMTILVLCLILFLFSYRKQTKYITRRIKRILSK